MGIDASRFNDSWIELSEHALRTNLRFLKKTFGTGPTFASVIKGNAYGHGIESFVPLALRCGVRQFAVFSAHEASRVRTVCGPATELMIMGDMPDPAVPWAIEQNVSFYVFDLRRLNRAVKAAVKIGRPARIHIELETGLNRTGFEPDKLARVAERIERAGNALSVEGTCTHYAGAESVGNYLRIQNQIARFKRRVQRLRDLGVDPGMLHSACSAAAMNYPETRMDMVRCGIAHYGFWPTAETRMQYFMGRRSRAKSDHLHRVMEWKSRVMSLKRVSQGRFIGYGISYQAPRHMKIASVPVGYYHGFSRSLSNLGYVLIRGERAPVVGLVNMNMFVVDVTDLNGVRPGDEVVIIGRQGESEIAVGSFADMTNYLNYEVLVRIPAEIPRIVVEGKAKS
jgi:alanine racemase